MSRDRVFQRQEGGQMSRWDGELEGGITLVGNYL